MVVESSNTRRTAESFNITLRGKYFWDTLGRVEHCYRSAYRDRSLTIWGSESSPYVRYPPGNRTQNWDVTHPAEPRSLERDIKPPVVEMHCSKKLEVELHGLACVITPHEIAFKVFSGCHVEIVFLQHNLGVKVLAGWQGFGFVDAYECPSKVAGNEPSSKYPWVHSTRGNPASCLHLPAFKTRPTGQGLSGPTASGNKQLME
ncbi:hypothetical protein H112_00818 [Trichophyton rubrum D6]|uniref:Uncharacterized protein n=1 Tax=Trichophyton rubrum (strain ATCC MYA-4607 / CBS 118892) TaxID=559305 RepID=A0A080WMB0_TRIRC|nr:uncharacterized protein TERG_12617 [Trichophyton rubrum CBS 118892]EZF27173.1 hypothetical protein H100_00816 [Trichophyton rubrum MR850]EZF46096.1 hypothetical protein H102_00808 [Trichophyton rubrum CBS 100081]EZF67541.1 hypothetical protein H104_00800 [Trichophyton rubrum CBS 289.86]EZG21206.1 hypothetical protein H107_00866 [Trichophyton rubrum CBS 202.88]KDB37951.1 hypothetical protein H112_00818 [Trichophyton rubrum D6]